MSHYRITEVATGKIVYDYAAEAMIWFDSWPASRYAQAEVIDTPPEPPAYNGSWRITKYAFRKRLTVDEKEDIEVASVDIAAATAANRKKSAALRVYMADIQAAEHIDLKDVDLRSGITKMQTIGLIAAGRAAVILDTVPTDVELFNV